MQSLKQLFRIGMGPSSSHTMAPRRAARIFQERAPGAAAYTVTLYGSLAATGRGHLTDLAISETLGALRTTILWHPEIILPRHPNGMKFQAMNKNGDALDEWTVFSIGGGELSSDGAPAETPDVYAPRNFSEMVAWAEREGRPLWSLVDEYEDQSIRPHLKEVWKRMSAAIDAGLTREGVLPGGLRLARKAASIYAKARGQKKSAARTGLLSAYALAVSEENAAGGTIVTAPTCGSCGVMPAVLRYCANEQKSSPEQIVNALAVAGLVGNTAKQNGSISGAEVGCQGEIGVACAMAAAAAAQLGGGTPSQVEYAAEIGLEHFLGLTCDPVMGLVQIPCIERNALAANKAMTAAEYALLSDGRHRVSLDDVITAMMRTGRDLPRLYRETSEGGLAAVISERPQSGD